MKKKKDRLFYIIAAALALALVCVIIALAASGGKETGAVSGRESSFATEESAAAGSSFAPEESSAAEQLSVPEESGTSEESRAPAPEKPLLVNADHALPEDYDPGEMVDAAAQTGRFFELAHVDMLLQREVYNALNTMCAAAAADGVEGFILTDAYRPRETQEQIYSESPEGYAAMPGHSEHETGLAFDISAYSDTGNFEDTPQFEWLYAHCAEYGFILRYPQGKEDITGIAYEPWHYRYVGAETAKEITEKGITLEEYCEE
ncbi:MAG: M15 family metallopeptidase [Clostridia bacterium]|nr:M15 family metallopeptidase [Clostridia bacterium]